MLDARIGRYLIKRELASGGMGVVYEAYDPALERLVAIKVMCSSADDERLSREARVLAKISHPNVVAVYDVGTVEGQVFLVLELIDGVTIREWRAARERSLRGILEVMLQAGQGLAAAHAAGVTHRDFKPENVMIGSDGRVRVLDFGLCASSERVGTPAYMAPEQLRCRAVSPTADQFSFCVVLWELVFGERPFSPQTLLELARNDELPRPVPPLNGRTAPRWLISSLEQGMALDDTERYPSMTALLAPLAAALARYASESIVMDDGEALRPHEH